MRQPLRSAAYYATIELYRTFVFEDGPFLKGLEEAGGELTAELLSRIARSYAVSRTIPASPAGIMPTNLELFATKIVELKSAWPDELQARAAMCRIAADELAANFNCKSDRKAAASPHSAVTKFMWFVAPERWTVYDRYAADALLRSDGNASERQARFYLQLDGYLQRWSSELRPFVEQIDGRLRPERLIDKYLVLRGAPTTSRNSAEKANNYFLDLIPADLGARLVSIANEVASRLGDQSIPRESSRKEALSKLNRLGLF